MNDPCAPWRERLWSVLDASALDANKGRAESTAVLEHLRGCAPCRAALDQAIRTERLLFTAAVVATPLPTTRPRQPSTASHRRPLTLRRKKPRNVSFLPWAAAAAILVIVLLARLAPAGRTGMTAFASVDEATALSVSDGRPVVVGATLTSGTELRGGPATLRLADGTRMWLDANSRVTLNDGGALRNGTRTGVLIHLDDGAVGIAAKPQNPLAPLAVQTPLAEAVVVGTAFRLVHDTSGSELTVTGGTVKLVSAGGERLVGAGGHLRVDAAAPPATLVASFSASSAVGTAAISQPVPGWSGSGWSDNRVLKAHAPRGSLSPILRQLGSGHGLCFNGVDQRLSIAIDSFDNRHGLTLIALVIPIHPGRDQRVVAITDGGRERVALVRHDLEPGSIAAVIDGTEHTRLDQPTGKHWSVACRWQHDGGLVLNTAAGAGKRVTAGKPAPLSAPHLVFGGSTQGRALEGDIIAIELHAGVLDDAALTARVRALASANHFPTSGW